MVAPIVPGAGIQQDGDDGEVEFGARPRGGIAPRRLGGNFGPKIASAENKMPPARVQRYFQIRINIANDARDEVRRMHELVEIDAEIFQLAREARREHLARAVAHRVGRE